MKNIKTSNFFKKGRLLLSLLLALLLAALLAAQVTLPGAAVFAADGATTLSSYAKGADGKRYRVTASYGAEAGIPADAALSVIPITEDSAGYDGYVAQAARALGRVADGGGEIQLFDISLVSGGDPSVRYQPAEGASVEMKVRLAEAPDGGLGVVHFGEEPEVLESAVSGRTVSFETTGFSVYAFVEARAAEAAFSGVFKGDLSDLDGKTLYISNKRGSVEYYLVGAPAAANWLAQANTQSNAQAFTFHRQEGG